MSTLFDTPEIFDIRKCPIWAIPQIAYIRNTISNLEVLSFTNYYSGMGHLAVEIRGEGFYIGAIFKEDMNKKVIPGFLETI